MKLRLGILFLELLLSVYGKSQMDTSECSLYKVYTNIFAVHCSLPACHDGSFEPDFRTPESAYYTLVDHPVIKNTASKTYKYRVVPKNAGASVLYARITNCCFVNTNDRMPLTILQKGDTLSRAETNMVKDWIEAGAADISGQPTRVTLSPIAIQTDYLSYANGSVCISGADNRIEKLAYKPFIIRKNLPNVRVEFNISTSDKERVGLLSGPVIKISDSMSNFAGARSQILKFNNGHLEGEIHPLDFKKNKIYYMKVEILDKKVQTLVTYPDRNTDDYNRSLWSFIITD